MSVYVLVNHQLSIALHSREVEVCCMSCVYIYIYIYMNLFACPVYTFICILHVLCIHLLNLRYFACPVNLRYFACPVI